jgi:hypothetical protein
VRLASSGHIPAAVWVAQGALEERLNLSVEEALEIGERLVRNGPWMFDSSQISSADKGVNRTAFLEYMSNAGDRIAAEFFTSSELPHLHWPVDWASE